jgi:hypothetical protein
MGDKRKLTDKQRYGLSEDEIIHAQRFLRKYKTKSIIPDHEASKLYEMYLLGESLYRLSIQFPQYSFGQIALTAAIKGWAYDRERIQSSIQERVKAKLVKSVVDQLDFLTSLLSVATAEHVTEMQNYVLDPKNNPKPKLRIESIKEYKEVVETLSRTVNNISNVVNNYKTPDAPKQLSNKSQKKGISYEQKQEIKDISPAKEGSNQQSSSENKSSQLENKELSIIDIVEE